MSKPAILEGKHPLRGRLFACADSTVRFVTGEARDSKLEAMLAPFRSEPEALAALVAAGCVVEGGAS